MERAGESARRAGSLSGKRMTHRVKRETETKGDGARRIEGKRAEGEERAALRAHAVLFLCPGPSGRGTARRVSMNGGASETTAIGYWKSVFL